MQKFFEIYKFGHKCARIGLTLFMLWGVFTFCIIFSAVNLLIPTSNSLSSQVTPLYLSIKSNEKDYVSKASKTDTSQNKNSIFCHNISKIKLKDASSGNVEEIDLDTYITGVVLAEVPGSFEPEAIKAQAVAARTYACNLMLCEKPRHTDAHICTDYKCCQAYITKEDFFKKYGNNAQKAYENAQIAVAETSKIVMLYDGNVIQAFFHASSGKSTYYSKDVWGKDLEYLKPVKAIETKDNLNGYVSKQTFDLKKIEYITNQKCTVNSITEFIGKQSTNEQGLVTSLKIGSKVYSGNKIRSLFNLKSACFETEVNSFNNTLTFTCYGNGHGVGMSQHGANLLAKQGYSYFDILKYYYTDIYFGFV